MADDERTEEGIMRDTPPRRRRAPRRVTPAYLENVALWYLGRFAASAKGLETVLMRRVYRAARHHGDDPAAGATMVAALIVRYRAAGLIDDAAFAAARARTLHARGLPLRAIAHRLRLKGVAAADIEAALAGLGETESPADGYDTTAARTLDLRAARAYARRRRLGPWRPPEARGPARERDLAALARAGFSYGVARAAVDGDVTEEA